MLNILHCYSAGNHFLIHKELAPLKLRPQDFLLCDLISAESFSKVGFTVFVELLYRAVRFELLVKL